MDYLISRKSVIDAINKEREYLVKRNQTGAEHILVKHALNVIWDLPISQAEPCDLCIHKDDCEDMKMYCPAMGCETDVKDKSTDTEKSK